MKHIFRFTWKQQMQSKKYRQGLLIGCLLCFLIPVLCFALTAKFSGSDSENDENFVTSAKTIYVVNQSTLPDFDWLSLNASATEQVPPMDYVRCDSLEAAAEQSQSDPTSLILLMDQDADTGALKLLVLLPDESSLDFDDCRAYQNFVLGFGNSILMNLIGLNEEYLTSLTADVQSNTYFQREDGSLLTQSEWTALRPSEDVNAEEPPADTADTVDSTADDAEGFLTVMGFVLPYLNVMLVYFMVLIYGQSSANQLILEKSSKLMDTFLIYVKPSDLMFGKVFATVLACLMQLLLWLASLLAGIGAGMKIGTTLNPALENAAAVRVLQYIIDGSQYFSITTALLSLLIMAAGFLFYCSLSAIGAALAGKQEDLSTTNVLFIAILIVSFFGAMFGGGVLSPNPNAGSGWMDFIPSMAVLITPSHLLLDQVPLWHGLISLGTLILADVLVLVIAGRLYKAMALFKGNPPKPSQIFRILKGN